MTSTGSPYLLDNAGADAPARLSALASMFDATTQRHLWTGDAVMDHEQPPIGRRLRDREDRVTESQSQEPDHAPER